jgi:hypothetical protein
MGCLKQKERHSSQEDSPAIAALVNSAATAEGSQAGNQTILVAAAAALLLWRRVLRVWLLVLHWRLWLAVLLFAALGVALRRGVALRGIALRAIALLSAVSLLRL